MADVAKLLQAAIQALETDAPDVARNFVAQAMIELETEADEGLPWSASSKNKMRFREYLRRMVEFLRRFASAPNGQVSLPEALEFAREIFPEKPRVVDTFYKKLLETVDTPTGPCVRLTAKGERQLVDVTNFLAKLDARPKST